MGHIVELWGFGMEPLALVLGMSRSQDSTIPVEMVAEMLAGYVPEVIGEEYMAVCLPPYHLR